MIRIPFTLETKESITKAQEAKGLILIEEQLHHDGKFLVFSSQPLINETAVTLESLEQRVKALEAKLK